jgi:capsid protein
VPPEILKLSFNSNYSASQAANNEFRSYLDKVRDYVGASFCQPIYEAWLLGEVLEKRIQCKQLIDAMLAGDFAGREAWFQATWTAAVKPATDLKKLVTGYVEQINNGLITRERAMKELGTGSFRREARKMLREADTMRAIMEASPWVMEPPQPAAQPPEDTPEKKQKAKQPKGVAEVEARVEALEDALEESVVDSIRGTT